MFIDKDGKIGKKFSIVDLCVIIAVVAALIGVGMRFFSNAGETAHKSVEFEFVVEIKHIRQPTIDALDRKGRLSDSTYVTDIGEIVSVEEKDMRFQSIDANGDLIVTGLPERYIAEVTIHAEGKESDSGYFLFDNTELSVGSNFVLISKYCRCEGGIKSIRVLEND